MNKINTTSNKKISTILTLFLLILIPFSYAADTNGIWHFAQDIQGGVFGQDEQVAGMHYRFINPVYFNETLYSKNIQNTGNIYIGEKISTKNLDVSDRADIDLAYVEELHAKNLRADSAYIDGDLNITGITSGADIYSNGDLVLTEGNYFDNLGDFATRTFVEEYVKTYVISTTSGGASQNMYQCPALATQSWTTTRRVGRGEYVTTTNYCSNNCNGLIGTSPTCNRQIVVTSGLTKSCVNQNNLCTYLGSLVQGTPPTVYSKTVSFPNTHFGSGYNEGTYCRTYAATPTPKTIAGYTFSKCVYENHGWKSGFCSATVEGSNIKVCISASSGADGYGWEGVVKYFN